MEFNPRYLIFFTLTFIAKAAVSDTDAEEAFGLALATVNRGVNRVQMLTKCPREGRG